MGFLSKAIKGAGNDVPFAAVNKMDEYGLGSPIAQLIGNGFRRGRHNKTPEQLLGDYVGYVYRTIDIKAVNEARIPIYTEMLIDNTWVRKSHEFEQTVLAGQDGAPNQTWMRKGLTTYREIFGEAFWYVNVMENSRKPHDRLLLYPNRIKVLANAQMRITGYIYTTEDGRQVPLLPDEIIHWKTFNPSNHLRGYSPLQAAGLYVDSERNAVEYVSNFVDNNATPAGIIVLPTNTTEGQFTAFERQWKEKYGGKDNAGKTAILQGDSVDFKQISSSVKDMQLAELKNMSRDDILGVLGMSKHMLGITDESGLGRSSAEAHEYIFAKHTTDPNLADIVDVLNDYFDVAYPDDKDKWRVAYDNPVPEDKDYKLQVAQAGGTFMSINERRAEFGLPPVDGGDVLIDVEGNVLEVKSNQKKVASIKIKLKTLAKPTATKQTPAKKKINKLDKSYEHKESYRLRIQDKQGKYERAYRKSIKGFIEEQERQVIEDLVGSKQIKSMMDGNLNPKKQADEMSKLAIGVFYELLEEQGQLAIKYAGGQEDFVLNQRQKDYVRASIDRAHLSYNEDIVAAIGKAVSTGLQEGKSIEQIGKLVHSEYDSVKGYKLTRLVRTETLKASNQATQFGYEQLGISEKEWFNNPGACDFCQEVQSMGAQSMQDVFVAKGEALTDGEGNERVYDYEDIEHPPLHANCRCVLLPVSVD